METNSNLMEIDDLNDDLLSDLAARIPGATLAEKLGSQLFDMIVPAFRGRYVWLLNQQQPPHIEPLWDARLRRRQQAAEEAAASEFWPDCPSGDRPTSRWKLVAVRRAKQQPNDDDEESARWWQRHKQPHRQKVWNG